MPEVTGFDSVKQQTLVGKLITDYFDDVILIDGRTGSVLNVTDRVVGKKRMERQYDGLFYDDQVVRTVCDKLPLAERESIRNALLLSTVREKLKEQSRYRVEVFSESDDAPVCEEITYEYLDEEKNTVVMLCQDIEDIVSSEIDPLTGLYNFTGFHSHVKKWLAEHPGRRYRMQRYNVDRFRDVNGIYGYEVGNKLLHDLGNYMKKYNTPNSVAGHLNADHFVRFCADDERTAEECYNDFNECFEESALKIPINLHIGGYDLCEPYCESFTMSYKALLALQSVKGNLTKKIAYYEKGMMDVETEQQELLADVEEAIAKEQFEVWFQPQTDFATHRTIGAEALIRWRHPKWGLLSPAMFIPLLEKSNYISVFGRYVFEHVCRYVRHWHDTLWNGEYIPVSVNLSRTDLYRDDLSERLVDLLHTYDVPPSAIHIEITESAYMDNSELFFSSLNRLRECGFRVEMDDFGSGYSSLNSLKDIHIDKLKLDMKFLSGAKDNRKGKIIISSVIGMAKALGLPVIAEGVETREQAEMLSGFGCNQMQGYYFSKPVPAAEYEALMRAEMEKSKQI